MTTLAAPIAKLYKRCARNHHATCPGAFETWSVCSCACHAGVSDLRPAAAATMPRPASQEAVTCLDKQDAVAEAVSIVTPKPAVNFGFKGTHRVGDAADSDSKHGKFNAITGKTNQLLRWTELFHMCATCAQDFSKTFASMNAAAKSTFAAGRMEMCTDCNAATKQALREYALSKAYARTCATELRGANYQTQHLPPVYLKP